MSASALDQSMFAAVFMSKTMRHAETIRKQNRHAGCRLSVVTSETFRAGPTNMHRTIRQRGRRRTPERTRSTIQQARRTSGTERRRRIRGRLCSRCGGSLRRPCSIEPTSTIERIACIRHRSSSNVRSKVDAGHSLRHAPGRRTHVRRTVSRPAFEEPRDFVDRFGGDTAREESFGDCEFVGRHL
jgi:hypothetical protein